MFSRKNPLFFGLIILGVFILLSGASCDNQDTNMEFDNNNISSINQSQDIDQGIDQKDNNQDDILVGADEDEYGCKGSAGYTWCESKKKCLRTWEEACPPIEAKKYESIAEEVDWRTYENEARGYRVSYPGVCDVLGNDLTQSVSFNGPLTDNERWPYITIAHYDSDFYNPPVDTKVADWVQKFPELTEGAEVSIAGLPTLHFVQDKSQQAYGADYYYFINNGQLYQITLLHTGDRQDWPLYNKFLESFSFVE